MTFREVKKEWTAVEDLGRGVMKFSNGETAVVNEFIYDMSNKTHPGMKVLMGDSDWIIHDHHEDCMGNVVEMLLEPSLDFAQSDSEVPMDCMWCTIIAIIDVLKHVVFSTFGYDTDNDYYKTMVSIIEDIFSIGKHVSAFDVYFWLTRVYFELLLLGSAHIFHELVLKEDRQGLYKELLEPWSPMITELISSVENKYFPGTFFTHRNRILSDNNWNIGFSVENEDFCLHKMNAIARFIYQGEACLMVALGSDEHFQGTDKTIIYVLEREVLSDINGVDIETISVDLLTKYGYELDNTYRPIHLRELPCN